MVKKFTYKVGKYNVLVLDAGSNLRYFDFLIECPTDLQAKPIHEMGSYLNNILIAFSKCFFVDSDYGQLSQETWTLLSDIYDRGPVLFYEGEKDNEENKDLQDEEEDVQRGMKQLIRNFRNIS